MVALAVRFCGQRPVTCGARPLLHRSYAALERRDYIAAGCCLREAVRLFLLAECEYYDCVPKTKKAKQHSAAALGKALRSAGEIEPEDLDWLLEIVDVGNQLAHLGFVQPSRVEFCIGIVHGYLDGSPYLVDALREGVRTDATEQQQPNRSPGSESKIRSGP